MDLIQSDLEQNLEQQNSEQQNSEQQISEQQISEQESVNQFISKINSCPKKILSNEELKDPKLTSTVEGISASIDTWKHRREELFKKLSEIDGITIAKPNNIRSLDILNKRKRKIWVGINCDNYTVIPGNTVGYLTDLDGVFKCIREA